MLISETDLFNWIAPNSKVLDLGCGDGELLEKLQKHGGVQGYGLEINAEDISKCIARGVNVIEQDLDKGLANFADLSYDTILMTQALQVLRRPDLVLEEMLRIGKQAIITFPNFAHWRCRTFLFFKGQMPVSKTLPYQWYDTPNIHLSTFKDFEILCKQKGIKILDKKVGYKKTFLNQVAPNLFGEIAVYRLSW